MRENLKAEQAKVTQLFRDADEVRRELLFEIKELNLARDALLEERERILFRDMSRRVANQRDTTDLG